MLIEEPIGAGVPGLLVTWVRGSTETIVAIKTAAAINETITASLDLDHIQGFTHSTGFFNSDCS
jgi:hypothetical protein